LYIFGGVNFLSILIVWALYPESNQRTLEEMDLVFASDSIWNWEAEKTFARLKAEHPELTQAERRASGNEAKGVLRPQKDVEHGHSLTSLNGTKPVVDACESSCAEHL
jgi:hypothetical protein